MTRRKAYQNLIKCASNSQASDNINNSEKFKNNERDDEKNDKKYDNQENNVLQNIIFLTTNDFHNFENEILFIQKGIK